MKMHSSRRGSALLVVLGMISFLVISAVAFSAYMRYSRLPSSYLRRTSASRLLVKAALAEAIDRVDRVVGNLPHPGLGGGWADRVFVGNANNATATSSGHVSPLSVEALAYIPPPLVNSVRYYSKESQSTVWQPFNFDAGRYVWCAVDVSDYFDVNRMVAGEHRTSASARRVTLTHLFEADDHADAGTGAEAWDKALAEVRGDFNKDTFLFDSIGSKYPFISVADFNLWLGDKGPFGKFDSPFCRFYSTGGNSNDGDAGYSSKVDSGRMTFVTDSKFVQPKYDNATHNGKKVFDLTDPQCQPFSSDYLSQDKPDLWGTLVGMELQGKTKNEMDLMQVLSGLGCAALYDYLDEDHYPISLAVPTVERVPMICGIDAIMPEAKFGFVKEYSHAESNGEPRQDGDGDAQAGEPGATRLVHQTVTYRLSPEFANGIKFGAVRALACYPFAHKDESDAKDFKIDGRLSLFFTTGDTSLRAIHEPINNTSCPYKLERDIPETLWDERNGVIHGKLKEQAVNLASKEIATEEDALQTVEFPLDSVFGQIKDYEIIRVDYEWTQTAESSSGDSGGIVTGGTEWKPKWSEVIRDKDLLSRSVKSAKCRLPPSVWDKGRWKGLDEDFTAGDKLVKYLQGALTGGGEKTLSLHAALWLRVREGNKTVDMVPASRFDDLVQNQFQPGEYEDAACESLGGDVPLILFDELASFNCTLDPNDNRGLDGLCGDAEDVALSPSAMFCSDPRYNHAPEDWYRTSSDLTASAWLGSVRSDMNGRDADSDIFMTTSDAGYLQSRYEFAHLPRFTDLERRGGDLAGNYSKPDSSVHSAIPSSFADTVHHNLAWCTYDPQDITEFVPWYNEGTGFKVNPYSDSTNVLMAAFANTPLDWKRSSTNETYRKMDAKAFNDKYAWNEYSSGASFAWNDLESIAGRFRDQVVNDRDWERAWDNLDWNFYPTPGEGSDEFCGVTLDSGKTDPLWCHDRKFLYGFWRDSFAARQQLFLIFVRAEPTMMGGEGQTPPQLGARAVALVWRDPRQTRMGAPHQTRILFYRQFE